MAGIRDPLKVIAWNHARTTAQKAPLTQAASKPQQKEKPMPIQDPFERMFADLSPEQRKRFPTVESLRAEANRRAQRTARELGHGPGSASQPTTGPSGETYLSPQARDLDRRMGLVDAASVAAERSRSRDTEFVVGAKKGRNQ